MSVETALDGEPQTDASVTLGEPAIADDRGARTRCSPRATSAASLSYESVAAALEEADATREQVAELYAYLDEQGIELVGARGGAPSPRPAGRRRRAEGRARPDRRAEPRLAAAVPARDRARARC